MALTCVWAALIPFSFSAHAAITMAASLALIELLWLLVALREGRTLAVGILFGLLWYTHLGMPWVALVTVAVWAVLEPSVRRPAVGLLLGLAAGLPWLLHVAAHRSFLRVFPRQENEALELSLALLVLAAIGFGVALRKIWRVARSRGTRPPKFASNVIPAMAMLAGFSVLAWRFAFRWVSGEGLVPLIVLSGIGLSAVVDRLGGTRNGRRGLAVLAAATLAAMWVPTLTVSSSRMQLVWRDAAPFHLSGYATRTLPFDVSLAAGGHAERLARAVAEATAPGDILWSNAPYALGLVAALAQRPMSSAMFYEVAPAVPFDPIHAARMILWFHGQELDGTPPVVALVAREGLIRVQQGPLADLWRNPQATASAHHPEAALSMAGAGMLLCLALVGLVWSFRGRQQ